MATENTYSIERTTGVVTPGAAAILVVNDIIPVAITFTQSAANVTETLLARSALAVAIRLGSMTEPILIQAAQHVIVSGVAKLLLRLDPDQQADIYRAASTTAWVEVTLAERAGPRNVYAYQGTIELPSPSGGGSPDTAAQIKTKLETLTGTDRLSVGAINNAEYDHGTVANGGSVTLVTTHARQKLTASGAAVTLAASGTYTAPTTVRLVLTATGTVTITVPSTVDVDFPAQPATSISATGPATVYVSFDPVTGVLANRRVSGAPVPATGSPETLAVGDFTQAATITAGTGKISFPMPFGMTLTEVMAAVDPPQATGSILTFDINKAGVSILSTKLTIDNTEETSATAATPAVISDASLAKGAKMTVDVDQVGDGTAKGLKIYLSGFRT